MLSDDIREIEIEFEPHPAQLEILDKAKRFNTINCGRRFGKTVLATFLLCGPAIEGYPTAYFGPIIKDFDEVWDYVIDVLGESGLIERVQSQLRTIKLTTGGKIEFWPMDKVNNGRSRKYKRVIIDEVAKVRDKIIKPLWEQSVRATLTDYKGDCFMFSTPMGLDRYWHKLCTKKHKYWQYFKFESSSNPHLDPQEIQDAKDDLPPLVFAQEYEAKFVNFTDIMFFNDWDEKYILTGEDQIEIDDFEPLYMSWDFNVNPMTVLLFQVLDHKGIAFIDEIQLIGGTHQMCERLEIYKDHPGLLKITGDYSGNSASTVSGLMPGGGFHTDYTTIKDELELNDSQLVDTRKVNKSHVLSRGFCNWAFHNGLVWINERCERLLSEIRTAIPTKEGKLLKNREDYPNDLVDAFRYGVHTQCNEGVNSLKRLKEIVYG